MKKASSAALILVWLGVPRRRSRSKQRAALRQRRLARPRRAPHGMRLDARSSPWQKTSRGQIRLQAASYAAQFRGAVAARGGANDYFTDVAQGKSRRTMSHARITRPRRHRGLREEVFRRRCRPDSERRGRRDDSPVVEAEGGRTVPLYDLATDWPSTTGNTSGGLRRH